MTNKEANNKKRNIIIIGILLLLLLCVSLGSAYLSQMLQVNGTTNIAKSSWDIHFANEAEQEGSVTAREPLTIDTSKTLITFGVTFTKPGEYYEFEVDTVNDGAMDAMVNRVTKVGISEENAKYISFETTYSDGAPINQYDLLAQKTSERIKVRVEFKEVDSALDLPSSDLDLDLELQIEYTQSDENAHEREEVKKEPAILVSYGLNRGDIANSSITPNVKRIILDTKINTPANAIATADLSEAKDGRVMAYVVVNSVDNTKYDLHIEGDGSLYMNANSSYAFSSYSNVEEIIGANKLNTSLVTIMDQTFSNCVKLVSMDTSTWDLSNVTSMNATFQNCMALTHLATSNWDLNNVKTMYSTFKGCSALTSLDGSNWGLVSLTSMNNAFENCTSLVTFNTANWNLRNVNSFAEVFKNCTALTYIDGSSWGFKSGVTLQFAFNNCTALVEIDASNWNLEKASLWSTFKDCSSLEKINNSNWDTSTVTLFNETFSGCNNLSDIDLSIFTFGSGGTSKMFAYCHKLNGTFNIRNSYGVDITSGQSMFLDINHTNGEQIVINYTAETEEYVDIEFDTLSHYVPNANIVKGSLIV